MSCHRLLILMLFWVPAAKAACTLHTTPVAWTVPNGGSIVIAAPTLVSENSVLSFCVKAPMTVSPTTYSGSGTGTITLAANGFVGINTLTITATDSGHTSCSSITKSIRIFVPTSGGTLGPSSIAKDCSQTNALSGELSGTVSASSPSIVFTTDDSCPNRGAAAFRVCPACLGCRFIKEQAYTTPPAALSGLAADGQAYFGAVWHAAAQRLYLAPFVATSRHANWLYIDATGNLHSYAAPSGVPTTTNYAAYYGMVYHDQLQRLYFVPNKYYADSSTWHYIDSSGSLQAYSHGLSGLAGQPAGGGYHPTLQRAYFAGTDTSPTWVYIDSAGTAVGYAKPTTNMGSPRGFVWVDTLKRLYVVPWGTWGTSNMGYFDDSGSWTTVPYPATTIGNAGAQVTGVLNGNVFFPTSSSSTAFFYIDGTDGVVKSDVSNPGGLSFFDTMNSVAFGNRVFLPGDAGNAHLYNLIDTSKTVKRIDLGGFYKENAQMAYHPALKRAYLIPVDVSVNAFSYIEFKQPPTCSNIIYRDALNDGSSAADWSGYSVDTASGLLGGTAGATWTCTSGINAKLNGQLVGAATGSFCAVPFSPVDGHTYYISVKLSTTEVSVNWGSLMLLSSLVLTNDGSAGRAGAQPWILVRSDSSLDPNLLSSIGNDRDPGTPVTPSKLTIKLDTTDSANWKATLFYNGKIILGGATILSPKPAITYISVGAHGATYTFSDFLVSDCRTDHLPSAE